MNITYNDIVAAMSLCYDPVTIGMPTDYNATITQFIRDYRHKVRDKEDILWVLCRNKYMTDKELRLYAVWCARQVQHLMTDQRSLDALDVAERFANGQATQEELAAAKDAARDAWVAAKTDAKAAAWDAARVAWAAAREAWVAAREAWVAARDAQIDELLRIFEGRSND